MLDGITVDPVGKGTSGHGDTEGQSSSGMSTRSSAWGILQEIQFEPGSFLIQLITHGVGIDIMRELRATHYSSSIQYILGSAEVQMIALSDIGIL